MRLREVFRYEFAYRIRSRSTWIQALFLFLVIGWGTLATADGHDAIHVNAPQQIAQRLECRARQERAADDADDQRRAGAEHQGAPEVREHEVARFAGLADLEHAVADFNRRDLEHGVAIAGVDLRPDRVGPAGQLGQIKGAEGFRQRIKQHIFERPDQPHE